MPMKEQYIIIIEFAVSPYAHFKATPYIAKLLHPLQSLCGMIITNPS